MSLNFTNLTHVPFLFYGVPKDSLNFIKHRYHSKKMGLENDYDNKLLKYRTLKELSDEVGQGRNDFMLARYGLKISAFYSQASRRIKECMYLPKMNNKDKACKINENTERINNSVDIIDNLMKKENCSLIGILDSKTNLLEEMIKSTISTEDILNQINEESKLFVEYSCSNENKPIQSSEIPEFDKSIYDAWEEIKTKNPKPDVPMEPIPETPELNNDDTIKNDCSQNEEPILLITPVKAILEVGDELNINVISRGGLVDYDIVYGESHLSTVSGENNKFIAFDKGNSEINYYLLNKENSEIIKAVKVLIEIKEKEVIEPEPPIDENKLELVLYTKNLEMIIGESANLSFKTNSDNPIFEIENFEMGKIEKDENGVYVFTALKEGKTKIKISVSNEKETLFDYTEVKIKEKYMEGYPKITGPDELGRKWLQKSQESTLVVLYPPYFVEWEKLLEQEKRRIPAYILIEEHQKELDCEGKIYDENGVPQYGPSYKYIKDMTREELDAIPFDNLLPEDKALLYADVDGNIVIEGDVHYKPDFKSWKKMCREEKELTVNKVGFENVYISHKLELYGNDNKVIVHSSDTYYPPNYKGWKNMTDEEKRTIDPSILTQENYDELFKAKTELKVIPDEVSLQETKSQEIVVESNASDFEVSSNDPKTATVEKQSGKFIVKAVKEGSCIVTVKAIAQDAAQAVIEIPVSVQALPATELTLTSENVTVKMGQPDAEVTATTNAASITAESKNTDKATVTVEGKVIKIKPVAEGTGTIEVKATAEDSKETVKVINFTIQAADPKPETSLSADPSTLTVKVESTVESNITTDAASISANVENTQYASVQVEGKKITVTGVEPGSTKVIITATAEGATEKQIEIPVTVEAKELPATELTLEPADTGTVKVGEELQITATTNAEGVVAESKDTGKATVTAEGKIVKVQGVSEGEVDIEVKATAADSKESVKVVRVTVTPAEQA